MNAAVPGEMLAGCKWIGIPFAGGMPELLHMKASTIVVNDLHRHVINAARVVADEELSKKMIEQLNGLPFHPDVLSDAQCVCQNFTPSPMEIPSLPLAVAYFVSQWMGRSGNGGKKKEFSGKLPVRTNGNGGDSNRRFRSAVEAITDFHVAMRCCNFTCCDAFEFFDQHCRDDPSNGLYIDAPWPGAGGEYLHRVDDETFHCRIRDRLLQFALSPIVVRYGEHELIRDLYSDAGQWEITEVSGRTQHGKNPELFIRSVGL